MDEYRGRKSLDLELLDVETKINDGPLDGVFVGTSPLEAMRALLSEAATLDDEEEKIEYRRLTTRLLRKMNTTAVRLHRPKFNKKHLHFIIGKRSQIVT